MPTEGHHRPWGLQLVPSRTLLLHVWSMGQQQEHFLGNSRMPNLRFHLRSPVDICMTTRLPGVACMVKSEKHLGLIRARVTPEEKVRLPRMGNKSGCGTVIDAGPLRDHSERSPGQSHNAHRWKTGSSGTLPRYFFTLACLKTQLLLIIVFPPWCKASIYRQHADICRSWAFLHQTRAWLKGCCWHLNEELEGSELCNFNYFLQFFFQESFLLSPSFKKKIKRKKRKSWQFSCKRNPCQEWFTARADTGFHRGRGAVALI